MIHRCYIDSNKVELTVETHSLFVCGERLMEKSKQTSSSGQNFTKAYGSITVVKMYFSLHSQSLFLSY